MYVFFFFFVCRQPSRRRHRTNFICSFPHIRTYFTQCLFSVGFFFGAVLTTVCVNRSKKKISLKDTWTSFRHFSLSQFWYFHGDFRLDRENQAPYFSLANFKEVYEIPNSFLLHPPIFFSYFGSKQ